nr:SH3 domain-containing protein [Anaerolineae bacterium]
MKLFLNFLVALAVSLLSLASFDAWSGEAAAETISYAEAIAIAEAKGLESPSSAAEFAPTAAGNVIVTTPSLNVRAYPSTASRIIGTLAAGTVVQVIAPWGNGTWLKIAYQGGEAYVYAAYT